MQATVIAAGVGFVLALTVRGANARENVARSLFAEDREIGKLKKKRLTDAERSQALRANDKNFRANATGTPALFNLSPLLAIVADDCRISRVR